MEQPTSEHDPPRNKYPHPITQKKTTKPKRDHHTKITTHNKIPLTGPQNHKTNHTNGNPPRAQPLQTPTRQNANKNKPHNYPPHQNHAKKKYLTNNKKTTHKHKKMHNSQPNTTQTP
eukprot:FR740256.1.p2 GENE.FR740256.1~~FR740256.1.p2  ORF type:complete len:117 (+),score=44.61 FR740256.1:695-1045(+)